MSVLAYRVLGSNYTGYGFNALILHRNTLKRSKCLWLQHSSASKLALDRKPQFVIGDSVIEYIYSWPHLGHIIASSNDDNLDILKIRNS